MQPAMRIGLIGLGSMGAPMGDCLVAAGYKLTVLDADKAKAASYAAERNCASATLASGVAAASDVVITILPNSAIVDAVVNRADGILSTARPGTILLDMTSGVPAVTRRLAKAAADKGVIFIDAPVSGGVPRAKTGDLAIMVGGNEQDIAKVNGVLEVLGSNIVHTGDVGTAHAMKALNNLVSAGGFLIGIEALLIGKKFGLKPDVMVDILNNSTGTNNSTQKKFKQFVLSRKFNAGFGLDLMVKDLSIAIDLAKETSTASPFSTLCREMWASASAVLGEGQDHTSMARLSEMLAGTDLADT